MPYGSSPRTWGPHQGHNGKGSDKVRPAAGELELQPGDVTTYTESRMESCCAVIIRARACNDTAQQGRLSVRSLSRRWMPNRVPDDLGNVTDERMNREGLLTGYPPRHPPGPEKGRG